MQSTPSLTWRRISSTASALVRHELADRGLGRADPGRVPVGQALMRRHDNGPAAMTRGPSNRPARIALRIDRLIWPASPGEQIAVKPGGGDLLGEEHAAQRAELERAVEVDVLLALGVAVGEMGVDVDEPRHDEIAGIVEHPVTARPPRRVRLRAGIVDRAALVEDQGLARSGLVLASGEQMAATDKGFHCRELPVEGTWVSF